MSERPSELTAEQKQILTTLGRAITWLFVSLKWGCIVSMLIAFTTGVGIALLIWKEVVR